MQGWTWRGREEGGREGGAAGVIGWVDDDARARPPEGTGKRKVREC